MRKLHPNLDGFESVKAGGKANLKLDVGQVTGISPTYSMFNTEIRWDPGAAPGTLMTQALMRTHIEEINFIATRATGGVARERVGLIDSLTYVEYQDIMLTKGYPLIDGYLPFFMLPLEYGVDQVAQDHFALGSQDLTSAVVELTLSAAMTSPELNMHAEILDGDVSPMGEVISYVGSTETAQAAAGKKTLRNLEVQGEKALKTLYIASSKITDHVIEVNDKPIDELPVALTDYYADIAAFNTGGRVPQAGYHVIDVAGNRYTDLWNMRNVGKFKLELAFNAAEADFRIIREEVIGVHSLPQSRG